MKSGTSMIIGKAFFILCLLSIAVSAQGADLSLDDQEVTQKKSFDWSPYEKVWQDDIQFHGFISQGLFHSSGNNIYGKSKNSVSAGLTELGINMSYQALSNLSFAVQGLYRRAGESTGDSGELTLDFAFADITLLTFSDARLGIRGGRIKNPWGIYNETRDVAFTHPTIMLPLLYYERSRGLLLAMNGGQLYIDYDTGIGGFSFKLNYGYLDDDNRELLFAITGDIEVNGQLEPEPSFMTQLRYEIQEGKYIFAISYADLKFSYDDNGSFNFYSGLKAHINPILFSAEYNGEKFSLTSEYSIQWNQFSGSLALTDARPTSEHWYIQAGYRIIDNVEFNIRYDSSIQDINDRKGQRLNQQTGLPAQLGYTQDWVFGLRWDITPKWMVRTEYHRVYGASMLSRQDNTDLEDVALHWNIFALQFAYRF